MLPLPKFPLLWLALLVLLFPQPLFAQKTFKTSVPSVVQITRRSGYIFAGTVLTVERTAGDSVKITFHIDRGIRGVRTGANLTIREWSGLWSVGERYRQGQRVMLFLYKPSKLGLTSPVGGSLGRMEVDPRGKIILQPAWQTELSRGSTPEPRLQNRVSVRDFTRALRRPAEE